MEQNDRPGGCDIAFQPVPYHDSILSIRDGSHHGYELCSMIWNSPFISWNHSETTHPLERCVTMLVTKPDSSVGAEYRLRHMPYIGQRFAAGHIALEENSWRLRLYFLLLETVQGSDNGEESINRLGVSITSIHQYGRVFMFFIDEGDEAFKKC
ncbi:uncharacterized protein TrAtP1_007612 [Trichoderma atroviride]|uniref:uncharacterized protein n=1 Tax=Hypocrea atroviridis TaxID=63577 RepID=UPI0033221DD9|nr:hypothetical protein TrAtP1_007612 [Trichoderma atroviride]